MRLWSVVEYVYNKCITKTLENVLKHRVSKEGSNDQPFSMSNCQCFKEVISRIVVIIWDTSNWPIYPVIYTGSHHTCYNYFKIVSKYEDHFIMYSSILVLKSSFFIILFLLVVSVAWRGFSVPRSFDAPEAFKVLLKKGIICLDCLGSCSLAPNVS